MQVRSSDEEFCFHGCLCYSAATCGEMVSSFSSTMFLVSSSGKTIGSTDLPAGYSTYSGTPGRPNCFKIFVIAGSAFVQSALILTIPRRAKLPGRRRFRARSLVEFARHAPGGGEVDEDGAAFRELGFEALRRERDPIAVRFAGCGFEFRRCANLPPMKYAPLPSTSASMSTSTTTRVRS